MVPVVFLINGIAKGDWAGALLFAISIAVGLTPEMLPMIMTSTLAKGAVSMSRHKVIVRTLGAIQTFGEMDVLCTDKTGTLTEDKVVLERYMDLKGDEDTRILRHAYLNSYFQTGLKNLIDLAIINRAEQYGLESVLSSYSRIDEIPFDFTRRRISVVLTDHKGKLQLITKGAVEEILEISSFVEMNGAVLPMDEETRRIAMATYEKYNSDGLRIIAVAQKNEVPGIGVFSVDDEQDMVLIGFIGFLDPPKESAGTAIAALRDHGVRTVVLTGDSEGVAAKVCSKVGVDASTMMTGREVEQMDDKELLKAVGICNLFATADIILLEKDLMVLEEGVIEGRRTFGNIIKYIKMAASGNFGNMISVIAASLLLPFLPMLPVQILTQNLLCDLSQMGIPFDDVDKEYLKKPHKWETKSIKTFMAFFGPLSSVFDILCYAVMWWAIGANRVELSPLFHCGWFVFGTLSQVLVIHLIRTEKLPFVQSRPSMPLFLSTFLIAVLALIIGFTGLSVGFDMSPLPVRFIPWLALILIGYLAAVQMMKKVYIHRYKEWM